MDIADHFDIPCLGVWDFDVLLSKPPGKRKSSRNNGQMLNQWKQFGLVCPEILIDLELDNQVLFNKFPSHRVFLIGNKSQANLERLFQKTWGSTWAAQLNAEGYYGPITYRGRVATHRWPQAWDSFLEPLFNAIKKLASEDDDLSPCGDNPSVSIR